MGNDRVQMLEAVMMLMMRMMRKKEIEERVSLLEDANNYVVKNCIKTIDSTGEMRGRFVSLTNQHHWKELE